MATYKKRGYKPANKEEQQLDENLHSTTAEVFNTLDAGASKTEQWVQRNQKAIIGVITALAVVGLGYLLYRQFVLEPKEVEASNEMFVAQQYFDAAVNSTDDKESLFNLALEGADGKYGLLEILKNTKVLKLLIWLSILLEWLTSILVNIKKQLVILKNLVVMMPF